ncbi:MAG: transglutaminase family protein [Rhodobacter sp.]|nr:transglutaminase family protein [Rhodobacter sp.]
MRLQVAHKTIYRFDRPIRGVVQSHRLTPSRFDGQTTLSWEVTVEGGSHGAGFRDGAGDLIDTVSVRGKVDALTIGVSGVVDTVDLSGVLRGHRESVPPLVYLRRTRATRADRAIDELARAAVAGRDNVLNQAHGLSQMVSETVEYRPGETHAETTAAEALAHGYGVCQDHAHVMVAVAISAGIPARYVAGYLYSAAGDEMAEASHAWAELYVPDLGWVGFDASNGCCPDERYIRLGSGYDAQDAAPIRGVAHGAAEEQLDVDVSVQQVQQ